MRAGDQNEKNTYGTGGVARAALRDGGATVEHIAIAPASAQEANWTLLHIDNERAFHPMFRALIRHIQARYDLAW